MSDLKPTPAPRNVIAPRLRGNTTSSENQHLSAFNDAGGSNTDAVGIASMMSQGFSAEELVYGTGHDINGSYGDIQGIYAGDASAGIDAHGAPSSVPTPPAEQGTLTMSKPKRSGNSHLAGKG